MGLWFWGINGRLYSHESGDQSCLTGLDNRKRFGYYKAMDTGGFLQFSWTIERGDSFKC